MNRVLIAYFSRAGENYFGNVIKNVEKGNTEIIAEKIHALTGAELFRIEMKEPYPEEYLKCIEIAKEDLKAKARPELAALPENPDDFDTVILAYPNYWGTMPMAVFSFLEKIDFSGKKILPLCTNEGSGLGNSEKDIRKTCPKTVVGKGLSINGSQADRSDKQIEKWLKGNGLL